MLGLPRSRILKKRKDFQAVYSRGKSYSNRFLVLYVFRSHGLQGKVGFAAGKKLGNAVKRNRVNIKCQDLEKAFLALGRKAGIMAGDKEVSKRERRRGR